MSSIIVFHNYKIGFCGSGGDIAKWELTGSGYLLTLINSCVGATMGSFEDCALSQCNIL